MYINLLAWYQLCCQVKQLFQYYLCYQAYESNIAYVVRHKLRGAEERVQKKTLDKNKTQVLFQQTAINK